MYWTLELASKLEDAPWPASKDELIDYAIRSGSPLEVIENLQEMEDEGEIYESIEDIWPDYPSKEDFFFNEDGTLNFISLCTALVIICCNISFCLFFSRDFFISLSANISVTPSVSNKTIS